MLGLCKQADLDVAIIKAGGATQTEEQFLISANFLARVYRAF